MGEGQSRCFRGAFVVADRSDDDGGLDATVAATIASLVSCGAETRGEFSDVSPDARLAGMLAGLFRTSALVEQCERFRVDCTVSTLHIRFGGGGALRDAGYPWDAVAAKAALSVVAELGVTGEVEYANFDSSEPLFVRWVLDGGLLAESLDVLCTPPERQIPLATYEKTLVGRQRYLWS
ncbi:hypothetical protein [Rhodococcus sp. AJR001]|uniref:hypothetical protein n=1 Tax=Rhodococcus sp. AJR001 TaxID=1852041 RepID=UPI0018D31373|nr:hypothetical protein [Rhodococcus sp. AJR001]